MKIQIDNRRQFKKIIEDNTRGKRNIIHGITEDNSGEWKTILFNKVAVDAMTPTIRVKIHTFKGAVIQRHRSSVISAVIQPVIRENVVWGIPLVRYWNSVVSNVKSMALNAGVKQMFVHSSVTRHPRSEIAKPENSWSVSLIKHSQQAWFAL